MTDRYERIRAALAMGPTPGPWVHDGDGVTADDEDVAVAMCCPSDAEAAYIAACDPDTIRELLAERDALATEVERLNWILGRIVACDGDSNLTIHADADAFAAAREYLLRDQEEGK